ncbi:uncharacterized protein [Argopecten irradians]|uniref:uncharacterized protein isoform X2 n=1 Tax=Argopecten irradians TaxID=31199 RepID=UPI0037236C7A
MIPGVIMRHYRKASHVDARMCSDDRVSSNRIILDTYEAEKSGNEVCSCKLQRKGDPTALQFLNIKSFGNLTNLDEFQCGSDVRLRSPNNEHIINCSSFPNIPTYVTPMDIIWTKSSEGDTKYCLEIKSTIPIDAILTVTCVSQQQTTTSGLPQCVSGEVRDIDQTVPTAQTEIESQCTSAETVILTIVIGYLLATFVVVGTVIYYRRKISQLEKELKTIADSRAVSTCTDISSINTEWTDASWARTGSAYVTRTRPSQRPPELQTGTIHEYDEIDLAPKRDSSMYLEPVKGDQIAPILMPE